MSLANYLTSKFKNTLLPIEDSIFYVSYVENLKGKTKEPEVQNEIEVRDSDWPFMVFVGSILLNGQWVEHKFKPGEKIKVIIPESQFVNFTESVYFFSKVPERQYKKALCAENCLFLNPWIFWFNLNCKVEDAYYAQVRSFYSSFLRIKKLSSRSIFNDVVSHKDLLYSLFYPNFYDLNEDFDVIKNRLGTALSPYFCSLYDHEGNLSLFYLFNKVGEIDKNKNRVLIKITNSVFEQEILDFVKHNENTISVL